MPDTTRRSSDLPKYLCHKTVQALKIRSVEPGAEPTLIPGGSWILTPEEPGHAALEVSHDWALKNKPQAGGYFVLYEDGYTSYSPAAAFENGYTKISDNFQGRVIEEKAELDAKLLKLREFTTTEKFASLDMAEQRLLQGQAVAMDGYSSILRRRIERFTPAA